MRSPYEASIYSIHYRAKYIEGLENRLGRMESLLRLSGLLSENDDGSTDLGTLEKRLAHKSARKSSVSFAEGTPRTAESTPAPSRHEGSESHHGTPIHIDADAPSPASDFSTPEEASKEPKKTEAEVEALSDMMCSLVTNNCGETRYIGR